VGLLRHERRRQRRSEGELVAANRIAAAALAVSFAAALVSCGGRSDKAGGERAAEPLVLTLEQSDPLYSGSRFAAAVAKRSGGSIRIDVSPEIHQARVDFERGIVEDVRAGRSDLGVVGVRVWDTLGVTTLQALIAPFLVDSLELERRVLESPLADRMLAGVDRSGVVGIALLPGPPRRPFGFRRALIGPETYDGARLGVHPGRVEAATLRSLGATTRPYLSLDGASREGAVLNFWGIAGGVGYRGKTIATNVVFWTRPETVVMNRRSFAALTPAQQDMLRDAGRQAVGPRLAEVARLEQAALRSLCERKLASLVSVPPAAVAALHEAVRPVYAELERDVRSAELIAEIRKLRSRHATDDGESVRCPDTANRGASELEGRWKSSMTRGELRANGATSAEAATYEGTSTLELKAGRWVFRGEHTTVTGGYTLDGDVIRLAMATCTANPCSPGEETEYTWSVYRDTLSFGRRSGESVWAVIAKPRTRIR
jgi:TRAP-type C4-dicarboxylate transport system substrate-binding protein